MYEGLSTSYIFPPLLMAETLTSYIITSYIFPPLLTAPPRQSHSVVTRGWFLAYYEQTEKQGFCVDLPVFWILRTKIGKKRVVVTLIEKNLKFF